MTKITIFITMYLLLVTNSFGQVADFNKAANIYIGNLEKSATPVFYTACKTPLGKAILIFPLDGKPGMLFELKDNIVVNSAPLIIRRRSISIDIEETQGGIYTYTVMENHAKDLLKFPFKFMMPEKVKAILHSTPRYICEDKPPSP